jgi:hypothetical protein
MTVELILTMTVDEQVQEDYAVFECNRCCNEINLGDEIHVWIERYQATLRHLRYGNGQVEYRCGACPLLGRLRAGSHRGPSGDGMTGPQYRAARGQLRRIVDWLLDEILDRDEPPAPLTYQPKEPT